MTGRAYGEAIGTLMWLAIVAPVLAFLLAFGLGWWCGDRFDVPSVSIEVQ